MEHLLPYLLVLICPISMGAMMLVMMRGNKDDKNRKPRREADLEKRVQELESELRERNVASPDAAPVGAGKR